MRLGGGALVVIVIASLIFGVNPLEMIGALESGAEVTPPAAQPPSAPGYGPQGSPRGRRRRARPMRPRTRRRISLRSSRRHRGRLARPVPSLGARTKRRGSCCFEGGSLRPAACVFRRRGRSIALPITSSTSIRVFTELSLRFSAPGDFAQAYVIAHEVGHHVQKLTRPMPRSSTRCAADARGRNPLSVRLDSATTTPVCGSSRSGETTLRPAISRRASARRRHRR